MLVTALLSRCWQWHDVATESCWLWRCLGDVSRGIMLMPSHDGDGVAVSMLLVAYC
jgi:hypothetical protein